jgi:hypothetical protein
MAVVYVQYFLRRCSTTFTYWGLRSCRSGHTIGFPAPSPNLVLISASISLINNISLNRSLFIIFCGSFLGFLSISVVPNLRPLSILFRLLRTQLIFFLRSRKDLILGRDSATSSEYHRISPLIRTGRGIFFSRSKYPRYPWLTS